MSTPPPLFRTAPLGYTGKSSRYDECVDATGRLRESWTGFFDYLGDDPAAKLAAATDTCRRAIIEQDVSMNVYLGQQTGTQPWPLDAVPLIISAEEWAKISRGLRQRAHLLNELLLDLYGPQKLLRSGLLPATLAMANPHFLRACAGLGLANGVFLHTYAADLARSPDGQWWVIEDRLDAPSGIGYTLQNRIIARQALPDLFPHAPVQRLYQFLHDYRASLAALSPHGEDAHITLLSPGPANETYFEQAYLSRYLGYDLAEGEDLITRDGQVFLRTVGGLKRTDVLLRRLDSDFCDPLELNAQSVLGVPGLVQAAQGGQIALANQLGARALETPALLAFLQPLCRHLLGEELLLPSAATWWGGQPGPLAYLLEHLPELVVKPTFRGPQAPAPRYGARLTPDARAQLADEIRARPWAWCAQERVIHGTTPGWHEGALRPMPFITRCFLARHDGDYHVMPGGLTRCNPRGEDMIVSLQQGGISKDTWILHEGRPDITPRLPGARTTEALRHPAATPSRTADNFFWLGRYLERCSQLARHLEKAGPLLRREIIALDPGVAADTLRHILDAQAAPVPPDTTPEQQAALVRQVSADPANPASLAANLDCLGNLLDRLKVRLPPEAAQLLRQLRRRPLLADPAAYAPLRQQLAALEGLTTETMPRDTAWHFLDLGRRLERGSQLLALLTNLLHPTDDVAPTEFRLQTVLNLADCLSTYGHVFHGSLTCEAALDWLFQAPENPRGLHFQLEHIHAHLALLPETLAPQAVTAMRASAFRLLSEIRVADLPALAAAPWDARQLFLDLRGDLITLSDRLTQIYFSHAVRG